MLCFGMFFYQKIRNSCSASPVHWLSISLSASCISAMQQSTVVPQRTLNDALNNVLMGSSHSSVRTVPTWSYSNCSSERLITMTVVHLVVTMAGDGGWSGVTGYCLSIYLPIYLSFNGTAHVASRYKDWTLLIHSATHSTERRGVGARGNFE